jgi:hypothetical protein
MDVIKFYNGMRNTTVGLPEWNSLHPQHQQMIIQAINLLLCVMHDNNVQGKE